VNQTAEQLTSKHCVPCEGGVPAFARGEVDEQIRALPDWQVTADGKRIRRERRMKNFLAAIRYFDRIAELAEAEGHHPDLHLTGYRQVAVELTTHAIGGLSENDFILAAKIDSMGDGA
jgi:4a-hydroxytetrahydrobiopterin dehydratase